MDQDQRVNRKLLIGYVVTIAMFALLAVRGEIHDRGIAANARDIELVVYNQCTLRNAASARSNAVIDRAIVEERAKPRPDRERIKQLEEFKTLHVDCGQRPRKDG